jgi:peptidoglycan hydrolase-like protein with peptidoglycan-binding domain
MKGEDIRNLQIYLNTHGFLITPSGPGSLGKETTLFGSLTKKSLIAFQRAHNILPATGTFGLKTRGFIEKGEK